MTKTYCDCCQKEIIGYGGFTFKYLCHIAGENRMLGHVKMIEGKSHPISGREEHKDLCVPCYNKIMYQAYDTFKALREKAIQPTDDL